MVAVIVACGGGGGSNAGDGNGASIATFTTVTPSAARGLPSVIALPTPTPLPGPPRNAEGQLTGFIYPIADACLPIGEQLMPNAPRPYRLGIHEGIDFYADDNCTFIRAGTPVVAVYEGIVIRIDHDYQDLTWETLRPLLDNPATEEALDQFRGQQVWIDHGNGVVTRYCHLGGVTPDLRPGDFVPQGTELGYVGESGTPESVTAPGTEIHLHFEVRVGDTFLGAGLPAHRVRADYVALFSSRAETNGN